MISRRKSYRRALSTFNDEESSTQKRSFVQTLKRKVRGVRQTLYITSADIAWIDLPETIEVFEPLGHDHLCAATTGGVQGSYTYDPPLGFYFTKLGAHTLRCTFRPKNRRLGDVVSEIDIVVVKARAILEWPLTPWAYETQPLVASRHLNARLLVPPHCQLAGKFVYDPPELTVLPIGSHHLKVTFVTDQKYRDLYESTSELVYNFAVRPRKVPVISWDAPADIYSSTRLSALQLNATCNVHHGTFEYTPPLGAVLVTKLHPVTATLRVRFVPTDLHLYSELSHSVPLLILPQEDAPIEWPCEDGNVRYGDVLSQELVDRCCGPAGEISVSPAVGYVFDRVGSAAVTVLFRSAMPRYRDTRREFYIPVGRAIPTIVWSGYIAPQYSTVTGGMLNATVAQPITGSFTYSKAVGALLDEVGEEMVSATFSTASEHLGLYEDRCSVSVLCRVQVQRQSELRWDCAGKDCLYHTEPLGTEQLNAHADNEGVFTYEPPLGALLPVGRHELNVSFQPHCRAFLPASASAFVTVSPQVLPTLLWCPLDDSLVYGEPLTDKHCNAHCPDTMGVFEYDPPLGETLKAGKSVEITAIFRPSSKRFLDGIQISTRLRVGRAVPLIRWQPPRYIYEGTALSELNALCAEVASVRDDDCGGHFEYTPGGNTVLSEGSHTLCVSFRTDKASLSNYHESSQKSVALTVRPRGQPALDWVAPADIVYGEPISAEQLAAFRTDSLRCAGSIRYDPSRGRVLDACERRWLRATFIPDDEVEFRRAHKEVFITIHKADPKVTWKDPPPTYANRCLEPRHYAASVEQDELQDGMFTYEPPLGTLLELHGDVTLTLTFTPPKKKVKNYNCLTITKTLVVLPLLKPVLEWPSLLPVDYGTPLGVDQLRPRCTNTPGTFRFSPANCEGTVLTVGVHVLKAMFIPGDSSTYYSSLVTASLEVRRAPPKVVWPDPPKLYIGKPLCADRLNARVVDELGDMKNPEGGTFIYSPAAGEMLCEEGVVRLVCYYKPSIEDEPLYRITSAFADLLVVRRKQPVPHPPSPPKAVSKQPRALLVNPPGNSDFVDTTMSY